MSENIIGTYDEGYRDGFRKGKEEANKVMEQMLHTSCNPIVYSMPETEAVKLLQEQIQKLKCCTNCKHYSMKFLPYFCIKNQTSPHCTERCDKWELSD